MGRLSPTKFEYIVIVHSKLRNNLCLADDIGFPLQESQQ